MAAIPRAYIERYTDAINHISADSRERLEAALLKIDYSQDIATVREQVVEVMQVYCGGATDLTAQLAAEFYDGLREYELGERTGAVAKSGRDPNATEGAVRAFVEKLKEDNVETFIRLCLDRLDYETKVAAGQTVLNNGRRDRRKPRFARVPTGAETCDFCLMLASRSFIYQSEQTASHAHSGCDCRIVPSWKAMSVEGYDPDDLYDQWQKAIDAKAAERAERNGTTVDEERRKIMHGYEKSAAKAKGRRMPEMSRASSPKSSPRYISDENALKQARILSRKFSQASSAWDAALEIVKAQEQWEKSTHSVKADNYFAERVGREMNKHGLSILDVEDAERWYYAN